MVSPLLDKIGLKKVSLPQWYKLYNFYYGDSAGRLYRDMPHIGTNKTQVDMPKQRRPVILVTTMTVTSETTMTVTSEVRKKRVRI